MSLVGSLQESRLRKKERERSLVIFNDSIKFTTENLFHVIYLYSVLERLTVHVVSAGAPVTRGAYWSTVADGLALETHDGRLGGLVAPRADWRSVLIVATALDSEGQRFARVGADDANRAAGGVREDGQFHAEAK